MYQDLIDGFYAGWITGFVMGNALLYFILYLPSRRLSDKYIERLTKRSN